MYIYEKISHDGKTEGLIVLSESSYVGSESRTRKTIERSLATGSTLICGSSLSDTPLVAYPLDVRDENQVCLRKVMNLRKRAYYNSVLNLLGLLSLDLKRLLTGIVHIAHR